MFPAIHQLLPTFSPGDAIGDHVLQIRNTLRAWGYASEIFAEHWDKRLAHECHPYTAYQRFSNPANLLILHYAIGSGVMQMARALPDRVVLYYHNITPAHFFYRYNGALARLLDEGRRQLRDFAEIAPALAGSSYNGDELAALGFKVVGVVPYTLELECADGSASAGWVDPRFAKRNTIDWLHVGRLAPNKCIHDLIKTFYFYHHWINRQSRLVLVGTSYGMDLYKDELHALVTQLELDGAVVFTGHVATPRPFYRMADVFVTLSEHEGFCVPLLEAMCHDVPVVGYAATAIPSTLGEAGILVRRKDYALIAELVHEVVSNTDLRQRLVEGQRARLAEFSPERTRAKLRHCLEILGGLPAV